jgi:hypothetical protein
MSFIFISYSRRDLDFAQRIVDALSEQHLDTWVDWKSIPKGEDWEQEIYRGIEQADAFLFLISPDSVKSQMCNKEIAHAIRNNKRILPILLREAKTGEFSERNIRTEIERLNWIFCREGQDDFARAIETARTTIRTDYDWVRFHTMLQNKALAWERAGKDGSRLIRGRELKEAEETITRLGGKAEPLLTEIQRLFVMKSRQAVKQRQALPYKLILALAAAIFFGGKFFFLVLPVPSACPQVKQVSVVLDAQNLPDDIRQGLQDAANSSLSGTRIRNCEGAVEKVRVSADLEPGTNAIDLFIRLPETPAYRMDFLQEIREFGPEPVSEQDAIALIEAVSAYSVGEYQTVISSLNGQDNLTALTLTAQAKLFTDDLPGSQLAYELALQKPKADPDYTGRLLMGAALSWWRPESYYQLSFDGKKDDCLQAGKYYSQARDWVENNKLAYNIRIVYAFFCVDEQDARYAGYADWKQLAPLSESDPQAQDAPYINATGQFILAQLNSDYGNAAEREVYVNHLSAARLLMLARAALSELYGGGDNCLEARAWRDTYKDGIVSPLEKEKLQTLLQSQRLVCP